MAEIMEYLVIVELSDSGLTVHGCVSYDLAHSERRIPHTSVLLVPFLKGTNQVVMHTRPEDRAISPGTLDFSGGHVSFDPSVFSGPDMLAECIRRTAIRESREELWVALDGKPHIIPTSDIHMITSVGELAADEPRNVEFSTGFAVALPDNAELLVADEARDGTVEPLPNCRFELPELVERFQRDRDAFADGAARVLTELQNPTSNASRNLTRIIDTYR